MNNPNPLNKFSFQYRHKKLSFHEPVVMGVLNVTPDSFFDGGTFEVETRAMDQVQRMLHAGAKIIDLGGYSSRPGADDVSVEEEIQRVLPVLKKMRSLYPDVWISIDTFRAGVAEECLKQGADIINDISGGQLDSQMMDVIANYNCGYVFMHMKGTPQNMQELTSYENIVSEVLTFLTNTKEVLEGKGCTNLMVDPGFGFAKTLDQNYELLHHLDKLQVLDLPILAGVSRKSMIYKFLNINAQEALNGTSVLNTISLMKGASVLRVHDVKEAHEVIRLWMKTNDSSLN